MQAVILAGGKGERLKPLTIDTPKTIVSMANKPFLETQIRLLKSVGITDIALSLSFLPTAIQQIMGDGSNLGVKLNYLIEPFPLGTAGAYKFAEKFIDSTTLVMNGDILTDIDLQLIINQHKQFNSTATIVLTEVENPSAYGLVEVGQNNQVLNFLEKPDVNYLNQLKVNTVNAGIYILEPRVLTSIPKKEKYSFEYQLFPALLKKKEPMHSYIIKDSYWLDIGTPERYLQAHIDIINGRIKDFPVCKKTKFKTIGKVDIDHRSIIGEGTIIKSGAKIVNSVIGKNVIIGENSVIRSSVVWSGTEISSQTNIEESIICNDCYFGNNISLNKGSILGRSTIIA